MQMKTRLVIFVILLMTCLSCRKSNYTPPVIVTIQDTLLNWKEIGHLPNVFLDDIWFTSLSRGFVVSDQIYQTADSGKTWAAIPNTSVTNGFYNLFFVNPQNGFAIGSSYFAATVNGGNSWTVKSLPKGAGLTIFFLTPSIGFYGDETGLGLNQTKDSGNNWVSVFNDQKMPQDYYPYFLNADTGFVVTGSGTFAVTSDGGQNWQVKPGTLPANAGSGVYNQLLFLDINTGFYAGPSGILKTTDGGLSWTNVLAAVGNDVNAIKFPNSQIGYYKAVSVIYRSSDGGQSWTLNCKLGTDHFLGMYFLDIHTGWTCTGDGRILRMQQ
jgi:photosystem II stability/assembly factor-like uncharacterized protein